LSTTLDWGSRLTFKRKNQGPLRLSWRSGKFLIFIDALPPRDFGWTVMFATVILQPEAFSVAGFMAKLMCVWMLQICFSQTQSELLVYSYKGLSCGSDTDVFEKPEEVDFKE
jgi:hypothetical protein